MNNTDKPLEPPVTLLVDGSAVHIATVRSAADLLASTQWPGERGPRHRDALDTCLKVLDGHRVVSEARRELLLAAEEAGLAVDA
jgi:hypothetical protein